MTSSAAVWACAPRRVLPGARRREPFGFFLFLAFFLAAGLDLRSPVRRLPPRPPPPLGLVPSSMCSIRSSAFSATSRAFSRRSKNLSRPSSMTRGRCQGVARSLVLSAIIADRTRRMPCRSPKRSRKPSARRSRSSASSGRCGVARWASAGSSAASQTVPAPAAKKLATVPTSASPVRWRDAHSRDV